MLKQIEMNGGIAISMMMIKVLDSHTIAVQRSKPRINGTASMRNGKIRVESTISSHWWNLRDRILVPIGIRMLHGSIPKK